jgi:hypothetical protein
MGSLGAAGLRCSVVVDMQLKQTAFAHHRGQVVEVGYGPQRMFINSLRDVWWNIRCVHLGSSAESLTRLIQQPTKKPALGGLECAC